MDRPFVYLNMAMTADGKITSAAREYPSFTSPSDREQMDRLRAEADALIVGAGTLRADDPTWHVRTPALREYRRSLGKEQAPHRVVVSARLDLPAESRFFDRSFGGDAIVATVDEAPDARVLALAERAEVWRVGRGAVDLAELLGRLRARGVERLLVEGGGELNWSLVRLDLVDEFHVTVAPSLLGGRGAPTWLEGEGLAMVAQRKLRLLDVRREGDELFLRWAVVR